MVAAPLILGGSYKFQTKIIEGGGPEHKLKFGGWAKLKRGPKILGVGAMNIVGKGGVMPPLF